jgi:hypothetical protein
LSSTTEVFTAASPTHTITVMRSTGKSVRAKVTSTQ